MSQLSGVALAFLTIFTLKTDVGTGTLIVESPIMKIRNDVKPLASINYHNKLKQRLLEISKDLPQPMVRLDLPSELKSLAEKHKNNIIEYKTRRKLATPAEAASLEVFAKKEDVIAVAKTTEPPSLKYVELNEIYDATEVPPETVEQFDHLPELEEVDAEYIKNHDEDFVLIDNKKDFPSADDEEKENDSESEETNRSGRKVLSLKSALKSGTAKRETNEVISKKELSKMAYKLIGQIQNETSEEKNERINHSMKKMLTFVGIVGKVDNYISNQARSVIKKLALLCDYDEKQNSRKKRRDRDYDD